MPPPRAQSHVICEHCGYAVGGMAASAACPECGREVSLSLPERRAGSPWQQRAGLGAWACTLVCVVRQPSRFWSRVRIDHRRAGGLLVCNCLVSSLGATTVLLGRWIDGRHASPGYLLAFFVVSFLILLALSSVEYTGIRFFGAQRGWRITRTSAMVIVAHASGAWIVAGFGMAGAGHLARNLPWLWDGRLSFGVHDIIWFALIAGAPVILGMVLFSTLCGVGFHALRYANPHDPARP